MCRATVLPFRHSLLVIIAHLGKIFNPDQWLNLIYNHDVMTVQPVGASVCMVVIFVYNQKRDTCAVYCPTVSCYILIKQYAITANFSCPHLPCITDTAVHLCISYLNKNEAML